VVVPRTVIDPLVLPPALLGLARRAFGPGVDDPAARPTAQEWLQALDTERARVRVCAARPLHSYGSHLDTCPWCDRIATTGRDLFNLVPPRDPTVPRPDTHRKMPPRPRPAQPSWRSREAVIAAIVIAVILVLALIAFAAG
jgi:DNA-binding helix-hairpin-helix protein with protein kinase domain